MSLNKNNFDLFNEIKKLNANRKYLVIIFLLSAFISSVISLNLKEIYNSTLIFSLSNQKSESQINNLASLAGINLNSITNTDLMYPSNYPLFLKDFNFKREILKIKLNDTLNFQDYLLNDNKKSQSFFNFFSKSNDTKSNDHISYNIDKKYFISDIEVSLFNILDKIIEIIPEKRNQTILISTKIDDPIVSSIITRKVYKLLESRIIEINIKSSKEVLNFNQKNLNIKEKEFLQVQKELSEFKDSNKMISSSLFQSELSVIQNRFDLIKSVYSELSKEVELAKIQVTKDSPVFTILKDSEIPSFRIWPKRKVIVILSTILSLIISCLYFIFKENIFSFFKKIIH